jgi:hypothetical protein
MGIRDENGLIVPDNSPRAPVVPASDLNPGKYPWYNVREDEMEWLEPADYIAKLEDEKSCLLKGIARRDQDIVELGRLFDLANIGNPSVIPAINEILQRALRLR